MFPLHKTPEPGSGSAGMQASPTVWSVFTSVSSRTSGPRGQRPIGFVHHCAPATARGLTLNWCTMNVCEMDKALQMLPSSTLPAPGGAVPCVRGYSTHRGGLGSEALRVLNAF